MERALKSDWSSARSYDSLMRAMKVKETVLTATEFKAKCLKILENLDRNGVVITKRGRPIARVTPIPAHDNAKLIGSMKGKVVIRGDLFSTGVKWDAES
jgi:prevent-host-death family protein